MNTHDNDPRVFVLSIKRLVFNKKFYENPFKKTSRFTCKPSEGYLHYNCLINTCTVASKLHPINANGINTLKEEIAGGNFCGIYFCNLGPQNQRNSQNSFLLFDRFRKTLWLLFLRLTPTRKRFAERDFVWCQH